MNRRQAVGVCLFMMVAAFVNAWFNNEPELHIATYFLPFGNQIFSLVVYLLLISPFTMTGLLCMIMYLVSRGENVTLIKITLAISTIALMLWTIFETAVIIYAREQIGVIQKITPAISFFWLVINFKAATALDLKSRSSAMY